jgi:hypothetical protein
MLTMLAAPPHRPTATRADCRLCGAPLHRSLLDLGTLPIAAGSLVATERDTLHPLHVRVCDHCGLAQTAEPPPGVSAVAGSFAATAAARPGRYAETLRDRFHLNADSLAIVIGSAALLPGLQAAGIPVLHAPAEPAGFTTEAAMQIAVRHGCADIVVAHDVLPHAADVFECAAALGCILRPNGVISLQFPHLQSLVQRDQFDAFRHDTCAWLSLSVTERLLRSVGLRVFDAERLPDEGGSLRLHACHAQSPRPSRPCLKAVRLAEMAALTDQPALFDGFAGRVDLAQHDIRAFLRFRREAGRKVAAYGATARGAMLLNVCGITPEEVTYVADPDPAQHGRLMPGSRIPILDPAVLSADPPEDLIMPPWPSAPEIIHRNPLLRHCGAQLWTLLPGIARL